MCRMTRCSARRLRHGWRLLLGLFVWAVHLGLYDFRGFIFFPPFLQQYLCTTRKFRHSSRQALRNGVNINKSPGGVFRMWVCFQPFTSSSSSIQRETQKRPVDNTLFSGSMTMTPQLTMDPSLENLICTIQSSKMSHKKS